MGNIKLGLEIQYTDKVKADLHNHLKTSSRMVGRDFDKAVDRASRRLGAGGVFGVVNFSDHRYEDFVNLSGYEREFLRGHSTYVPEKDIYIVKGQEVPTEQGHLLVFGTAFGKQIKEGRTLEDTIKEARDFDGIIVADHPYGYMGLGPHLERNPELYERLDALEVHNGEMAFGLPVGPFPLGANRKAQELYEKIHGQYKNLGAISSSDGHSMCELGSSWTEIDRPSKENFVGSLRESVRGASLRTRYKMQDSVIGAINHIADVILISKVGTKIMPKGFYSGSW